MKNRLIPACLFCLLSANAVAKTACPPLNQQVNDSNNVILLEGTGKGNVKQVIVGGFGKDINQQARLLGTFDVCGRLTQADFTFQQTENGVTVEMVNHLESSPQGWEAVYEVVVTTRKGEQNVPIRLKQGRIRYQMGQQGNITSASDTFLLQGEEGFTQTTYRYNPSMLLTHSVARGTDPLANGEMVWQWNQRGQLLSGKSDKRETRYHYDEHFRETQMITTEKTETGKTVTVDECQLWDETGNCTLTYTRESESLPGRTLTRNLGTAMKYTYWDQPGDVSE